MPSRVSSVPPASSNDAAAYFESLLRFETDCSDTHHAITHNEQDFVLLDVRSADDFAQSHVPHAINLPHREINAAALASYPGDTLFVVYCAGQHCNGADKAALKLALLNRPVKKMLGGIKGWVDEGYALAD